ncbi:ABC transporter permease [Loigolactobacillus coryniformis]|jgi:D-methionine transport system permease protein|uniref:Methionine ABC transporter permease n=2 Tax=Loigolactobacillus coryniformis TaxID=1610 RepID=A0A2D1KS90_9LACO|nr:methionine ABC transporter permease [Loigolactobacillus coryniformis subsp. torquens DSM 20004 = KCTC 3535]MBW4802213.1 ABC transporter permease [Loigolactobacillus coryniformis subsp. torquens]MDC4185567.1 ABC transporter permease [Loigolactobacillus coryniformis]MDT3390836.1 ABC transporter permease [Bacillota bacterium]KRK84617.1 methionine ABC transporter transmembrane protein [Loigolactobacillus coryniformis subsp. torquens DSM 20004 = KCTC 3535]
MWSATIETIWMTIFSLVLVAILGVLLGLLLFETTGSTNFWARLVHGLTALFVNVFRSVPFIILIVLLLPLTKNLVGTIIGPKAALPSLIISAAPFYARMVELAFHEIDHGVIEAAEAMGATRWQIVYKVLLPESSPALVSGITVTGISLIGFTAMAGVIGAGGLGNLAYLDGFQASNNTVTLVATIIILLVVFVCQTIGDFVVKRLDKRVAN